MTNKPLFNLGARVRFKDHVFTDPNFTPHFDRYKDQEFIVTGYMPDEGIEFSVHGVKEFSNPGFVYDHIGLTCCTAEVQVQGFVHDCDLMIVKV